MKNKRLKKDDQVIIITGKDRGKIGVVTKVMPERCVVEGVNVVKRHRKPSQKNQQGGIETTSASIHLSNVMLYDATTEKRSRVGMKTVGEEVVRFYKKSGELVASK